MQYSNLPRYFLKNSYAVKPSFHKILFSWYLKDSLKAIRENFKRFYLV